jgi:hypothetical protein
MSLMRSNHLYARCSLREAEASLPHGSVIGDGSVITLQAYHTQQGSEVGEVVRKCYGDRSSRADHAMVHLIARPNPFLADVPEAQDRS